MQRWSRFGVRVVLPAMIAGSLALSPVLKTAQAQSSGQSITVRADIQEANSKTGVVTARGNVQINYPARNIQATAAQAQYFSNERRLVLNGNVFVTQEGNTLQGETITYLIDEGRFVALPQENQQVESTYIIEDNP